jgi:hypothetical protein
MARDARRGRARDADVDELHAHLQRSMTQAAYERACELGLLGYLDPEGGVDEGTGGPERPRNRVDGFTEKQANVGFTGAGDRSLGRRGRSLAQMFADIPVPQQL